MQKIILAILLFICFTPPDFLKSQIFHNWAVRYNGPNSGEDKAYSLVTKSTTQDVFVTGVSWGDNTSRTDCVTMKYDICASQDFLNRYNGPFNELDYGYDISINTSSDVYIAGDSYHGGLPGTQYLGIKYNYYGSQLWALNDGPYGLDYLRKVKTYQNIIYFGGCSSNNDPNHIVLDIYIMKMDANGNILWSRYYGNPYDEEKLADMTVDQYGNLYCAGQDYSTTYGVQWVILKYDPNGNLLWTAHYNGYLNNSDFPKAIDVDNTTGNVYVTGQSMDYAIPPDDGSSEGFETFTTVKFSSNGQFLWAQKHFCSGNTLFKASGNSIKVRNDEAYVTGFAVGSHDDRDFITVKYNSIGTKQWLQDYSYVQHGQDISNKLDMDNYGNVYVTGQSYGYNYDAQSNDYTTIKYDNNGNLQWVMRYDGIGGQVDESHDIQVIDDDIVYVTGWSDRDPDPGIVDYDYVTIRYASGWITPNCDNPGFSSGNPLRKISKLNDSSAVAVGDMGTLKFSTDRGINWRNINSGIMNRFNSLNIDKNKIILTGESGTILYSSNNGTSWLNRSLNSNDEIRSIQFIGSNNIYCAGTGGQLYKSQNSGISWSSKTISSSATVNSIYVNLINDLNKISFINSTRGILIGNDGKLLKTVNGGETWQSISTGYSDNFNDVCFLNSNTGYISGSNGLILCTTDGGTNWKKQKTYSNLNFTSVTFLDSAHGIAVSDEGTVILTNMGEKSYDNNESYSKGKQEETALLNTYKLDQNYPNPFNPVTVIRYSVPEVSKVSLKVYDVTGKQVIELVNDNKDKGTFDVTFNAVNLSSGIYYYQLNVYDLNGTSVIYSESKKMILIK
jgi:photosystem II stability/assembly factor-like uncharacterized protein